MVSVRPKRPSPLAGAGVRAEHRAMVQTQEVVGERRVRRCRSVLEKRQIVQLMLEPGASVAEVPRAHGVTANQVFAWRRAFERSRLTQPYCRLSRHLSEMPVIQPIGVEL
jgi:transposase-like protein